MNSTPSPNLHLYEALKNHFRSWVNDHEFSFVERLSRENQWSPNFTRRALHEYIKFVYLCSQSPAPLTPSDEVDQVWHLHMQYMKKYQEMNKIMGMSLTHGPTKGGSEENQKFDSWYEITKQFYTDTFKQPPPEDIWPPAEIRFKISPKAIRVNPHYVIIIKKPLFYTYLFLNLVIIGGLLCLNLF